MPFCQNITPVSLTEQTWTLHSQAALHWLEKSITVTGGKGSSHSYHLLLGWSKAYPETTGYLIPTLLEYAQLTGVTRYNALAEQCLEWLLTVQFDDGAFPGLLAGSGRRSVFNTSQILFGLAAMAEQQPEDEKILQSIRRAVDWLMEQLESEGSWRKHAFVPGFTPAYYTRTVWGVLEANQILKSGIVASAMERALHFYQEHFFAADTIWDWGFAPGKPAFTHTVAYTLEGALESALFLHNRLLEAAVLKRANRLLDLWQAHGRRMPGRMDADWLGDFSFRCLTGNAQLSAFYFRLHELYGDDRYLNAAMALLTGETLPFQWMHRRMPQYGGLPGSAPVWGAYLPMRLPNWAPKFLLDALSKARKHLHIE